MNAPYRKPGECLPDLPEPAVIRTRPTGKGVWINMLKSRGRDLRVRRSSWRSRLGLVEVLILVACAAVLAVIVLYALNADLRDTSCQCSCHPQPCTCRCDDWF